MSRNHYDTDMLYVVRPSTVIYHRKIDKYEEILEKNAAAITPVSKKEAKKALELGEIVRPTNIVSDIYWYVQRASLKRAKKNNVNSITQILLFINDPRDITIAVKERGIYRNVFTNEMLYPGTAFHLRKGQRCLELLDNDTMPMAKHLWERNEENSAYDDEAMKKIIARKPFLTMKELELLYDEIKFDTVMNEVYEEPIRLRLKNKIKRQIVRDHVAFF